MQRNSKPLSFPFNKMRAGALALALTAILLPACANNTEEPEVTEPNATEPEVTDSNATVEDVAENADELFGQVVTVRGEPDEILDNVSFTLSDDEFFGGDEILIVNSSGEPFTLPEDGTNIQVTGEVRQFSAFDFEEEFELDWTPAEDYGERPTIVAQSIAISPEPGEVTGNPEEYYGQTVAVEGEVEEVADATTFTLEEEQLVGGENLTVINLTEPAQGIEEGNQIVVTGQVRPFVLAEIEKDYDLTWDLELKEKLEAEYSNKPVLVATGIYPSATEE